MKNLAWHLRRWSMLLGAPVLAACIALAASAALYWGVTVPGMARLMQQKRQHADQATRVAPLDAATAAQRAEHARLEALLARFPRADNRALNAVVVALQEQARLHQLVVDSASYQLSVGGTDAAELERYTISLPLKGRYPELRAFMRQVREQVPHLALDSVVMSRSAKDSPVLEAQLEFTAFFRRRS